MIRIPKLAFIAALTAMSAASPALAQSFDPESGTGNVLPLQYQADGGRNNWTVVEPNVRIAARNGDAMQVAAHNKSAVKIAGHRAAQRGS
jgi:hypothetical protein